MTTKGCYIQAFAGFTHQCRKGVTRVYQDQEYQNRLAGYEAISKEIHEALPEELREKVQEMEFAATALDAISEDEVFMSGFKAGLALGELLYSGKTMNSLLMELTNSAGNMVEKKQ